MVTEPSINKNTLIESVASQYNLAVKELIFIPKGEVSWGYIVVCQNGDKFFLKIHKAKNLSPQRFQLLYELYSKANITQIVHPIPTKENKLEILVNQYPTVLFNYIDGATSQDTPMTQTQYKQLGELLGRIHKSKKIISDFPTKETFDIPYKGEFLKVLSVIDQKKSSNSLQKTALDLLYPIKNRLREELKKLETVRKQLLNEKIEFVLCHGEPTPDNIIIDNLGVVYLVDWDEPIIAPKEKDLLFFSQTIEAVMRGYAKYSQDTHINQAIKNFYTHLWNVNEIADWGGRIFINKVEDAEGTHIISSLKHFLSYSRI